jgi:hypothetical protein
MRNTIVTASTVEHPYNIRVYNQDTVYERNKIHELRKRMRGFHGSATVALNNDRNHDKSAAPEERRGSLPPHTHTDASQLTNETTNGSTMMNLN